MHSLRLELSISFAVLLFALPSARAGTVGVKDRAAKRACLNGDPIRGVQILTELYLSTNDPTYIYNQGRCFEQNNRYEEAIARFREYLRKVTDTPDANQANVQTAQKHISDCEAVLGKTTGALPAPPAPPPPAKPAPVPAPEPTPPARSRSAPVVPVQAPQPEVMIQRAGQDGEHSTGLGLRVAGVVTAAVGGAALITGLVMNLKVNNAVGDIQRRYNPNTDSSSKDDKTLSQVSYGVGAAFVAGGALLYYLGWRAGHQVAVTPSVSMGTAGAVLTGAF